MGKVLVSTPNAMEKREKKEDRRRKKGGEIQGREAPTVKTVSRCGLIPLEGEVIHARS